MKPVGSLSGDHPREPNTRLPFIPPLSGEYTWVQHSDAVSADASAGTRTQDARQARGVSVSGTHPGRRCFP